MEAKLRVGVVPFLNARPLARFLETSGRPELELSLEAPSRLTQLMNEARLDVALLPSIEYFRAGKYRMIPDISISADGPVQSVMIYSKAPVDTIRSLALDRSSRTSAALAAILLKRRLGSLPHLTSCAPGDTLDAIESDAMLLIGDPAMSYRLDGSAFTLDLGEEWKSRTGLPFVYATWVVRNGVDTTGLQSKLLKARDRGLASLRMISQEASKETGLSEEVCFSYLTQVMRYTLGPREIEALRLFHALAVEDGLCPGGVEIAFDNG